MSTDMHRSMCLISHSKSLTEIDFIVQNIEYSLRNDQARLHGVISPYSKNYRKSIGAIASICAKLKKVYGLSSLVVDISLTGDQGVLAQIDKHKIQRNNRGVYSNEEQIFNYLLLNSTLEQQGSNILEDLIFWKMIEESKKSYDILFLLPSIKNISIIEKLEVNAQVQWMFIEKKNSAKTFKNLESLTHFQVPFQGIVSV